MHAKAPPGHDGAPLAVPAGQLQEMTQRVGAAWDTQERFPRPRHAAKVWLTAIQYLAATFSGTSQHSGALHHEAKAEQMRH